MLYSERESFLTFIFEFQGYTLHYNNRIIAFGSTGNKLVIFISLLKNMIK